jgi:hypothetical protein
MLKSLANLAKLSVFDKPTQRKLTQNQRTNQSHPGLEQCTIQPTTPNTPKSHTIRSTLTYNENSTTYNNVSSSYAY